MTVGVPGNQYAVKDHVVQVDETLFERLAAMDSPTMDRVMLPLTRAADHSLLWLAVAGAMVVTGHPRAVPTAGQAVATLGVTSFLANQVAKRMAFRKRPPRNLVPARRRTPAKDSSSFPSGHAASAVAFVVVACRQQPLLVAPLSVLAAGVAFSRVFTGMHYPSDVAAGVALGVLTGVTSRRLSDLDLPSIVANQSRRWSRR